MDIIYQTRLNNTPIIRSKFNNYIFKLSPLTVESIVSLESTYNNGHVFPASLRELLFLAGQECYILDYGMNGTQEEMQNDARSWLIDYDFSLTRPFFVIDVHRGSEVFLFVYLDENLNDPNVYQANMNKHIDPDYYWLTDLQASLSSFVNARIDNILNGYNPY